MAEEKNGANHQEGIMITNDPDSPPVIATVKIVTRGQVMIPAVVRERLGLKEGDLVEIQVRKIVPQGKLTDGGMKSGKNQSNEIYGR